MDTQEKELKAECKHHLRADLDNMKPGERYQWQKEAERLVLKIRLFEFLKNKSGDNNG